MSRWLYLVVGAVAAIAIAGVVVVLASNGDGGSGAGSDTTHEAWGVPPDVARVKQTVVAFRRALQSRGGDPCAYMTTRARNELLERTRGRFSSGRTSCADEARATYADQRQTPAEEPVAVVVGRAEAVAGRNGTLFDVVRLRREASTWRIDSIVGYASDAGPLEDALKRGEGQ